MPLCLLNVSTNLAWAPTHMCLPCVCVYVCILRLVSLPLNKHVYTFIPGNMWHVCTYQHDSACTGVYLTVCLRVFYDFFFIVCLCVFVQVPCTAPPSCWFPLSSGLSSATAASGMKHKDKTESQWVGQ